MTVPQLDVVDLKVLPQLLEVSAHSLAAFRSVSQDAAIDRERRGDQGLAHHHVPHQEKRQDRADLLASGTDQRLGRISERLLNGSHPGRVMKRSAVRMGEYKFVPLLVLDR